MSYIIYLNDLSLRQKHNIYNISIERGYKIHSNNLSQNCMGVDERDLI